MFGKTATAPGGKPSGMDMMIQSLLRSMGVGPDALVTYIEQGKQLAMQFVGAMQNTSARLDAIEIEQKAQRALLESIAADNVAREQAQRALIESTTRETGVM